MKRILWVLGIIFVLANVIVFNHAYCFTHFSDTATERPKRPEELSTIQKIKTLFTGVRVPKPKNTIEPSRPFSTFYLDSHKKIEGWDIPVDSSKGVVILYHGYISCKANMLTYAEAFSQKGYTTILIDFMGCGGSAGVQTSIGFKEGRDVKESFAYAKEKYPGQEIILFGVSMGAASIMKGVDEYGINPDKLILECPFGSMLETAKGRFEIMGLPTTPLAHWLVFYGGLQTGFNAFKHNPIDYARNISIPTALFVGGKDARVSQKEMNAILANLQGNKSLTVFENSGHEMYLNHDNEQWHATVDSFLAR